MPAVSVVIVTHNSREEIEECLSSLPSDVETIIVDNASQDGTPEVAAACRPDALLIRNTANRGFGVANNQGLAAATGTYALLLNPDAKAKPGSIEKLAAALDERPDAVAAGGLLRFPDGSLQDSVAGRLTLWALFCEQTGLERVLHCYWQTRRWLARGPGPHEVEQVMGACLMLRRQPGGDFPAFEERFFLYCEDTELCRRLRSCGAILFVPEAEFVHQLGTSSEETRWRAVAYYNRGKELYFRIHHGAAAWVLALAMNRLGALLRLLGWIALLPIKPRSAARKIPLFLRVLFAPIDTYSAWAGHKT
ncbi:MAG: glycosyltransferase family 2 protein [Armatimonadetes bacterium]|nr:MAG: glycosyltransferase family 2 protein [Armatimonadota bacterium]